MRHSFGPYTLDEYARDLALRGAAVPVQPLVFDLLAYLIRNAGRVVSKDELMDALWPNVFVTEASLQRLVSLARRALRPGRQDQAIRSFVRHGYRFDMAPEAGVADDEAASNELSRPAAISGSAGWSRPSGIERRPEPAGDDVARPSFRRQSLNQTLGFCTSSDGTRIAVASTGAGPALLRAAYWPSDVSCDIESPIWSPWIETLSRRSRFIRYDARGCGMSERRCSDNSRQAWQEDFDAVAANVPDRRFAILGISLGGALAIDYAVRHPERVSHLILLNAFAQGARARARSDADRLEAETLVNLMRIGWGRSNPVFRQLFASLLIPGGTPDQLRWCGDVKREIASPEVGAEMLGWMQEIDLTELCAKVRVPTLVVSSRHAVCTPFEQGARLAGEISGSRFVPLDSANQILLPAEPSWTVFHQEIQRFLFADAEPVAA